MMIPPKAKRAILNDLKRSNLTPGDSVKMRIRYVPSLRMNELHPGICDDAYEIRYFDIKGKPINYSRYRFLEEVWLPESKKDSSKKRLIKYLQLPGAKSRFYFPPFLKWWKIARNTEVEIFFVEGEKKAASLCKLGFPAIGLGGIWNWLTKNDRGPSDLISDFNLIDWKNRKTTIVFDADV
jgi:hypothetical protein